MSAAAMAYVWGPSTSAVSCNSMLANMIVAFRRLDWTAAAPVSQPGQTPAPAHLVPRLLVDSASSPRTFDCRSIAYLAKDDRYPKMTGCILVNNHSGATQPNR